MQVPRLEKITLNMGVGEAKQDTKMLDAAAEQLAAIAGQKPAVRRARKSIANFKLREGMPVGVMATLRGERMWEMLDRLQSIAIPRIRDFRGLNPRSFDGRGNYSMGVREQIIFPEIDYDAIDQVRGLERHDHDHGRDRRGGARAAAAARDAVPPRRRRGPDRGRDATGAGGRATGGRPRSRPREQLAAEAPAKPEAEAATRAPASRRRALCERRRARNPRSE